jgi:hypothetical protein
VGPASQREGGRRRIPVQDLTRWATG